MSRRTTVRALLCLICCAPACMRVLSTPDLWPCASSSDCESNETCFFRADSSAANGVGECRPIGYVEPGVISAGGQGSHAGWASSGTAGQAGLNSIAAQGGSLSIGGTGGVVSPGGSPGIAGTNGGSSDEVPVAGSGGGHGLPCGGGLWPEVDYVSPQVVANHPSAIIIRGRGFSSVGPVLTVSLGGGPVGSVVPDSDTQITFETPVLPTAPAYYSVGVGSDQCPGTSNARLLVMNPTELSSRTISAPSTRDRIVFDAERHMLYAANRTDQLVERYHENAGNWETLKPYAVPDLTDIGMAPNGHSLLVASRTAISEIDLDAATFAATPRAVIPDTFCDQYFQQLAIANDGNVIVVTRLASCSGNTTPFKYSVRDNSVTLAGPFLDFGIASASFDGSRIYLGGSQSTINVYNSLSETFTNSPNVMYELRSLSVSGDASRVILQNTDVRSRALVLTGKLPDGGVALASIDSKRAFVYRTDTAGAHLIVHDLNGALEAGALYPVLKAIDLTDSASAADDIYPSITMTSTPDDSAVFISGTHNILVVPVN